MTKKPILLFLALMAVSLGISGCMEDSGFEIVWEGREVEFEAASLPNRTLTEVVFLDNSQSSQTDLAMLRINLVGAQIPGELTLSIGVDPSSTAVQGVHYRMERTDITIPPNTSFVDLPIEILTANLATEEAPDLVLNIIEADDVKVSANYGSVTLQIRLACASNLAGTYRTVNVGTGGTLNYQVTITEVEPLTYRISDITGGVYALLYGAKDNPAVFTDLCGELTVFDQPDLVFGNDKFNGTGRVNADGTIVISWKNENEDSGVTTLTPIN
jgi:hypothetical protein